MAEILLSAFFTVLFEKLASATLKKLARSKGIREPLEKWERSLSQIQAVLFDAAQKEITEESVKRWLDGLQHLAYDIDDVLDDLATEAMHRELTDESGANTNKVRKFIPTCCPGFSLNTRMSDKLNNITTKLQNLVEETNTLGLIVKVGKSKKMNRRLETSLVDVPSIMGRQGDKEALLQKLLGDEHCNQNFKVVPIVGLGGVGKTTLARLLYNETQVKDHFELKAWACVSDEFDIFKISKIIFQSLTGGNQEFADLNMLQLALREKLSDKRFLFVLDDVWSESYADWEILVRPFLVGAPGSKIILTTRKLKLLTQLGYDQPYLLQILSNDDALSLFAQQALGENNFDLHPMLKPHGEGIVKKCNGLPLALIALGRLLRTKANEEEWKELLNSQIWRLQKGSDEIIPALKLSYHDLPAHLKQLFAYCSLFPKDYMFDKDELVLLWMAEGFLPKLAESIPMERFGRKCFEELLSRSFFQQVSDVESSYMMHDLMNDLATFVAGDFFFRLDAEMDVDIKNEALEKYRHMSFIRKKYGVYGKFKVFQRAKSLRTFIAASVGVKEHWQRFYLSNKVLVELLPQLPFLRVLSLSEYEISEVPEFIGSLKHLRYLNLSQTRITHLPENIGNLYNLQTLMVCGCKRLSMLPNNFVKLKNLRHLDISDTPRLEKMPLGIGELIGLQTLSKVIIGGGNGFAITELKDLNGLHGRLSIQGLDKVKSTMDIKNANLLEKEFNDLEMEWSDKHDGARNETLEKQVINMMKPNNDKLTKLEIVSYVGIEFPSWVGDPSYLRLAHVKIRGCKKCTTLPPLGQLPSLKELFVENMDGVKVVGTEFLGTGNCCGGVAFPSLEILSFVNMLGWELWSTNSRVTEAVFPCLQKLRIHDCCNLVEASLAAVPSLQVLDIRRCCEGVLRCVVHAASSITNLKVEDISGLTQMHGEVMERLGATQSISIVGCYEMRYLWESEALTSKILVNLRNLNVSYCKNLMRLGEKEEDSCGSGLTSLRKVWIWHCGSLKHYNCPNSIEKLSIYNCPSLISVCFPTGGQNLKTLRIEDCEELLEEESSRGGEKSRVLLNTSLSVLEFVEINRWTNLKSFPSFSCFIRLTTLQIKNCENLESFPDNELQDLTSLTILVIYDCPNIDDSFPRGLWPPKLSSLIIGGLKKPISEWGLQNFPTSLVRLWLMGAPSDDVGRISQLSHLLPSSLTSLEMYNFEKLESFSMGLQHLISLKHLRIYNCPNIRDLPETLLPSLLGLHIYECPKLKERCSKRGSYWPHIFHIPCVELGN